MMRRQDDIAPMFDQLTELTHLQRETIKSRYRFLMREYCYRSRLYSFLFYLLRICMTVGSLVVPALLSLKGSSSESDTALYWLTWAISLAVTTSNGLLTLFKLDKRFFMIHAVTERLRSETWQYLTLGGRYSGHHGGHRPTHTNQYVYFVSRLEKIRMKHVDDEYVRPAGEGGRDHAVQNNGVAAAVQEENTVRDTIGGTNVPTPPDQAALPASPDQRSRESAATVGDDEEAGGTTEDTPVTVQMHDERRAAMPATGTTRNIVL
jgi:hypothetical protein